MTRNGGEARGDELVARVLEGDDLSSGIANDLLNEFYRGYPIDHLVKLLHSDDEQIVQSGAWIASELARDARPILKDLIPLFVSPNMNVRYYCVETTLTAAGDTDGDVMGCAVERIMDSERPVRKMAFVLMARADTLPLTAGMPHITHREIAALLAWVLGVESEIGQADEVAARLREPEGLPRLFAVIAAARIYARDSQYLKLAATLSDAEADSLAASELAWLSKMQAQDDLRRERSERRNV